MAVIIPQVVTEDRANEARAIDGSLKFNSANSQYLSRTPTSAGNRRIWTLSMWVKRTGSFGSFGGYFWSAGTWSSGNLNSGAYWSSADKIVWFNGTNAVGTDAQITTNQVFRDPSAWYHLVFRQDTTNSTSTDRFRLYVNGALASVTVDTTPTQNHDSAWNGLFSHSLGGNSSHNTYSNHHFSEVYFIDGQSLDASSFGFTDPLTNTWRPKKYVATTTITGDTGGSVGFGTNGFYLPFDGNFPIGQNKSGNVGIAWTAVNFGGSNTIEKATGALPILNTVSGGKIASVGVRTDSNASSLVLALPLVGIKSDFSNAINGGTSNKAVTANGNAAASSTQSNFYGGSFYFDGTSDYIDIAASSDFAFGTGDFTVECWIYTTNTTSDSFYRRIYLTDGPTGNAGGNFQIALEPSTGKVNLWDSVLNLLGTSNVCNGAWHHIAGCRSGTTLRLFVDGVLESSTTYSTSVSPNSGSPRPRIGSYDGTTGDFDGYIQDIRVYKGLAKYTQNFIPASTDPDILPDTPSGVAYSSNVALVPSTDGAVAFDGSGDYLRSTGLDAIGTSDYTIECFLYLDYISGTRQYIWDTRNSSGSSGTYLIKNELNTWYWTPDSTTSNDNSLSLDTIPTNKWTHIAFVRQSGTAKLYVDGILKATLTSHSGNLTSTQATIFAAWDNNVPGKGFISNFHIVNGTALYTSNFTPPTAPITSVANTKLLCCKSNSSATAADVTPGTITANGNAVATIFNPFTVNINTVRGQESGYATLNTVDARSNSLTLADGNLTVTFTSASQTRAASTIGVSTGKYYYEATMNTVGGTYPAVGVCGIVTSTHDTFVGQDTGSFGYYSSGGVNGTGGSGGTYTSYTAGDTIGIAIDLTNSRLTFYKNGVNAVTSGTTYEPLTSGNGYRAAVSGFSNGKWTVNFGQKPFNFPPPVGFQPLALANTPRPTIVRPDQYVNTIIWSGTGGGSGATRSLTGLGFKPDFVWQKARSSGTSHRLLDSVRGAGTGKTLSTNNTNAEGNGGSDESLYGYLSSFDRDGFTLTNGTSTFDNGNKSGDTYVAWAWKAGGNSNTFNINDIGYSTASAAGLTAGTITPTGASINTKSGFSIIAYTGNGVSNATVSHGLGAIPSFAIVKSRSSNSWFIRHNSLDSDKNLNFTSGGMVSPDGSGIVGNLTSSTTFTLKNGSNNTDNINANGTTYIAYLWAEIAGFSKFGKYTGNGSSDGVFVYCGFRPRWILIKVTASTGGADNWRLIDTVRTSYNGDAQQLNANTADLEDTGSGAGYVDINSNGFKIRTTALQLNASGVSIIFAAFAESPQFNLYGGQSNAR